MKFIYRIFMFVSVILLLIGVGISIYETLFLNKAITSEGTVIDLKAESSSNGTSYRPIVQFHTKDGKVETFISSSNYKIGDKMNVLYYYQDGQILKAKINSFMTLWFAPIFLFFMGSIYGTVSFIGLYKLRNKKSLGVTFNYELSGKEIKYYFKKKKLCPICNGKLLKEARRVDRGIGETQWVDSFSYTYGQRIDIDHWYKCSTCGESFSIKQLASND